MRVALCLSGHFRSFDRTLSTLKSAIIDPFQPDVFIHTWDKIGFDGTRGDHHLISSPTNAGLINHCYQPKNMLIEPMPAWDTKKYHVIENIGVRDPGIICGMLYGIYKSGQMKTAFEQNNGFTYDVVIRCRPDIYFENIIPKTELENCQQTEGIYFPKFGNYNGLNDQFAFGSSKKMNIYCNLYSNMEKFYDLGCKFHPESMMKYNAEHFNIPILRSSVNYFLLRANGQAFRLECKTKYGDVE